MYFSFEYFCLVQKNSTWKMQEKLDLVSLEHFESFNANLKGL